MPSILPPLIGQLDRRYRPICIASMLIGLSGCGAQTTFQSATDTPVTGPTPQMVLSAAYDLEGSQRQVVFVSAQNLSTDELETVMASLADELGVDVLPAELAYRGDPDLPALTPIDPDTGSIGVSLTLRQLIEVDPDEYQATISYARNGLDGGDMVLQLVRVKGTWQVTSVAYTAQA